MPRVGFKTITVTENIYDIFYQTWLKCKDDLAMKGVSSFSGYITYLIEEIMKEDKIFTKYLQVFTKISVDKSRIILKDNIKNRIVELTNKKGLLFCLLCNRDDCQHVGFCWSFPEIYR